MLVSLDGVCGYQFSVPTSLTFMWSACLDPVAACVCKLPSAVVCLPLLSPLIRTTLSVVLTVHQQYYFWFLKHPYVSYFMVFTQPIPSARKALPPDPIPSPITHTPGRFLSSFSTGPGVTFWGKKKVFLAILGKLVLPTVCPPSTP